MSTFLGLMPTFEAAEATNLFVTSKNGFFNSPILEFKVLQDVFKIKKRLKMFFKVIIHH